MGVMQIPRRVDYALRAAIYLSHQDPERSCSLAEIARHQGVPRKFLEKIIQNLIRDLLVEDPAVSELDHVVLQRLELHASRIGHIHNADLAEVREAGFGADRGELRAADRDLELALRTRIRKGLDRRRA